MTPSGEALREEVQHLRKMLTEKEEKLSTAISMRQWRSVAYVNTLALLLSTTEAALEESKMKQADLEETCHKQLQEESLIKRLRERAGRPVVKIE